MLVYDVMSRHRADGCQVPRQVHPVLQNARRDDGKWNPCDGLGGKPPQPETAHAFCIRSPALTNLNGIRCLISHALRCGRLRITSSMTLGSEATTF
eukprot:652845-Rhodomonas_salina.7